MLARPSNEDPQLNLTQKGQKRKGELLSSLKKRQETLNFKERRKNWPLCPLYNTKHFIRAEGECYLAKPKTAPLG